MMEPMFIIGLGIGIFIGECIMATWVFLNTKKVIRTIQGGN